MSKKKKTSKTNVVSFGIKKEDGILEAQKYKQREGHKTHTATAQDTFKAGTRCYHPKPFTYNFKAFLFLAASTRHEGVYCNHFFYSFIFFIRPVIYF